MTNLIFKYRGTFDKYLGDAIMAFWGAPVATGDDVYHAICAAVEMRDTFNQMRIDTLDIMGSLGLGLGIHFGEATVGNIGSERVMDYTAIGDTVNVAARLQQLAKSSEILITESAYLEVKGRITVTRLNQRQLSGRRDSVTVYSVQNVVE